MEASKAILINYIIVDGAETCIINIKIQCVQRPDVMVVLNLSAVRLVDFQLGTQSQVQDV